MGRPRQIAVIGGRAFVGNETDGFTPAPDGIYEVRGESDLRTAAQNRALHLWFRQLADALTEKGADIKTTIRADVPWTPDAVKELIWRPVQRALIKRSSTRALKKSDIDPVVNAINKLLGERFGVHVPFPSIDEIIFRMNFEAQKAKEKR